MLEVSKLSFSYNAGRADAVPALHTLDLQIDSGELLAVIGHNGSGKSTLAKLLVGMLQPTEGQIVVDGLPSTPSSIWEIRRRVGMVFQRPDDQLIANTVIDDIAFGPENLGLPRDEIELRVREAIEALDLGGRINTQISDLSGGEKQRVAIAGVLAMRPNYMIWDEPTTMIAPRQARNLIALAHELRERTGVSIIHITHFMHEIVAFDRVVVMDGGRKVMEGTPREIFAEADALRAIGLNVPLVTELGRRLARRSIISAGTLIRNAELVEALRPKAAALPASEPRPEPREEAVSAAEQAEPLIKVRDLRFSYMAGTPLEQLALDGVDCEVYEGETLAILGGSQAGKSTLVEFFNGLRRAGKGHVWYRGRDVGESGFDLSQLRREVGIVFQQPESQLLEDIVGKDVSYVPRKKKLPPAESRALVERALTDVGLDYETYRLRYIYALSGGQKRRVALAGVLAADPKVLILDEPVAGLDPRGRSELAELIRKLSQRSGLTVVLVGNTIDELSELADRALVLHKGKVVRQGSLRQLLRHADELHALGLALSEAAELALDLRTIFPNLPLDLLDLDELETALLAQGLAV